MLIVALILWAGGSVVSLLASRETWQIVLPVWAGIAILIAAWGLLEDRARRRSRIHACEQALRGREVRVFRIQSAEVVAFEEEEEDEGACYAFQVADRIVFIAGQDFYASARFPNSDFSLIELSDGKANVVDSLVDTHGKRLQPTRTIAAGMKAKLRAPEHLEVLLGKLEDIERLLVT